MGLFFRVEQNAAPRSLNRNPMIRANTAILILSPDGSLSGQPFDIIAGNDTPQTREQLRTMPQSFFSDRSFVVQHVTLAAIDRAGSRQNRFRGDLRHHIEVCGAGYARRSVIHLPGRRKHRIHSRPRGTAKGKLIVPDLHYQSPARNTLNTGNSAVLALWRGIETTSQAWPEACSSKKTIPVSTVRVIERQTIMYRLRTLAVCLCLTAIARAQTPPPVVPPTFDVASIKPAAPGARGTFINNSAGGLVRITNMTLKDLLVFAYRVQPFQVSGGPPWVDSDHYDIEAKPDKDPGPDQSRIMLQGLLADRFGLKIHRETKEMPVYELVMLKNTGKPTPGLAEIFEGSCVERDPGGAPPPPPSSGQPIDKMPCGMMRMGPDQMFGTSQPLSQLATLLSRMLGRTVIDKTGIDKKYNIQLQWSPDQSQSLHLSPDANRPPFDPNGPSIFTALQEQLGLKLESKKGPVEILMIDHADKPSEN